MRDIFSDLYNKVMSFFVTQSSVDPTKGVAKSRLKTVLMQDRVGFSERAMQMLKEELVSTISKYMEIDEELFDLAIDATESATVLNLSIPVTRAKTDEEIDKAIEEQANKTQAKAQEIVQELEELIKERAAELAGVDADEEVEAAETVETVEEAQESVEEVEANVETTEEAQNADEETVSDEQEVENTKETNQKAVKVKEN